MSEKTPRENPPYFLAGNLELKNREKVDEKIEGIFFFLVICYILYLTLEIFAFHHHLAKIKNVS